MIQQILRFLTKISLRVYCEKLRVKGREIVDEKGPILIMANHPNSFLDAVIIGAFYRRKIHFMARGDVFKNWFINKLLRSFGLIPIHRIREGIQYMSKNSESFSEAVSILEKDGIVLIFIEGICLNKHELQPFKKGTVRILEQCQERGFYPKLHLAGIAYHDFREIRKKVHLHLKKIAPIKIGEISERKKFNEIVYKELESLIDIPDYHPKTRGLYWLSPYKWYFLVFNPIIKKLFYKTVFYDSVLFLIVFFLGTTLHFLILISLFFL